MSGIDRVLSPQDAARLVRSLAHSLTHLDHLPSDTALRLACERVADGDPLALAAAGQLWTLREDADIDDAPARQLIVTGRFTAPPRVAVHDPDTGEGDELLIEVLDLYTLAEWQPAALLGGDW
jgi:hypothetical protein